ncbi:MAG: bifunctional acetate--CoA ligase family protein/GNAT family N-acetyltransferase [Desulfovermiculus sp.]|nr:bifunctional acetate--CoA ligase family protein/GNAT family N-acetyltransferase [Desulfovermiculus sp.]
MTIYNLDYLFNPKSVAVLGASEKPGSIGSALMLNMTQAGFAGALFPVNPKYEAIYGHKTLSSVTKAQTEIDLAVIATPIATVPDLVDECVQAGVKAAIIISAGGKETGAEGQKIEKVILERARKGKLRILGPNCLGIICPGNGLNASFAAHTPEMGKLAFISQSGAICTSMLDLSLQEKMGFRYFISIGSMLDVDFGDLIDYVGSDPQVESILLYIESLTNIRKFMSAARGVSRVKPIVIIKSGKSPAGAKAASSHTGAMAGEDVVYDTAFKRAGAVRVNSIGDFFRCAELLSKQRRPRGPRMVVLTNSGGPGVMAVDALFEYGLEASTLSKETINKLDKVLPQHWSRGNPIDILGDATAERYVQAVNCLDPKELDGLLIIMNPQAMTDPAQVAKELITVLTPKPFPVLTSWMGGQGVEKGIEIFNNASIPTYATPEDAIKSFMYLRNYAKNLQKLTEIPPKAPRKLRLDRDRARELVETGLARKSGLLTEAESKDLIQAYGIPVNRTETAASEDEAAQMAKDMGYPLAMKLLSLDITHKTDAGGVHLYLRNEDEVRSAYAQIMQSAHAYDPKANILGVTIQPMVIRPELELLLGAKKDDNFGPVLLFGMGGIFAEVLEDRNLALPPLNHLLASRLISGTKVSRLLYGFRNRPGVDMPLLEETIIRLAHLVVDFPEIVELDMNPLVIDGGKPLAIDARAFIQPSSVASPQHLVISPYPSQYEYDKVITDSGLEIAIRPIQPEDASYLVELFQTLSPTSIYYRFFQPLKTLPPDMLARFTQIDYDREMALVALSRVDGQDRIVGVARVTGHIDGQKGEFAILIGDPWQGKGVGEELLKNCLDIVRDMHIEQVWGLVLPSNTGMLKLGDKLGFQKKRLAHEDVYELTKDLRGGL